MVSVVERGAGTLNQRKEPELILKNSREPEKQTNLEALKLTSLKVCSKQYFSFYFLKI